MFQYSQDYKQVQILKMKDEKRNRFRFSIHKSPKQIHHWLFEALLLLAGSAAMWNTKVEHTNLRYRREPGSHAAAGFPSVQNAMRFVFIIIEMLSSRIIPAAFPYFWGR